MATWIRVGALLLLIGYDTILILPTPIYKYIEKTYFHSMCHADGTLEIEKGKDLGTGPFEEAFSVHAIDLNGTDLVGVGTVIFPNGDKMTR